MQARRLLVVDSVCPLTPEVALARLHLATTFERIDIAYKQLSALQGVARAYVVDVKFIVCVCV